MATRFSLVVPANHGKGVNRKSRRERQRRLEMFDHQDGACYWCKEPMELNHIITTSLGRVKQNPRFATFEHLLPRSAGGHSTRKNLVLAHESCNNRRAKRRWPHDPFYGKQPTLEAVKPPEKYPAHYNQILAQTE